MDDFMYYYYYLHPDHNNEDMQKENNFRTMLYNELHLQQEEIYINVFQGIRNLLYFNYDHLLVLMEEYHTNQI